MGKTSKYWDDRAIKRLTGAEKTSEQYIKQVQKMYDRAYRNINKEIETIYKSYSNDTGIDVNTLKQLLTKKETSKVFKELKAKGYDKYIKDNYKSRITRLEQLKAQIYAKAKDVYSEEELISHKCYGEVYKNSYYRSIYDTQMGTGLDFGFSTIDNNLIETLLNERWSGKNYKQRIWGNTDILAESVSEIVGGAILSGQSLSKTTQQIRERFGVCKYYAERLVRTETNHFYNEADALAYEEMGIDKYVFVAVLDSRTSPMCQSYDNKVLDYKDKKVGVNFPPLHPNCRSTTRGYLGEEAEKSLQRRARDPKTGKTELINNMSYKEWAKSKGLEDSKTKRGGQLPAKPVVDTSKSVKIEVKPLTDRDKQALEYYVSGEGMYVSNALRGVNKDIILNDKDMEFIKDLDHATDRPLEKQRLYRSVDASVIFKDINEFEYEDLRGYLNYGAKGTYETNRYNNLMSKQVKEFKDLGYVSTTKDYEIARDWGGFTGSNKPIVLELNLDDTVKGVDLDFLDIADDPQKETLLARNQIFKVKEITAKDGNIYVKVDVTSGDVVKDSVKEATKDVFKTENLPAWFKDYKGNADEEAKLLTDWLNKNGYSNSKASKVFSNSIKDIGNGNTNITKQAFTKYKVRQAFPQPVVYTDVEISETVTRLLETFKQQVYSIKGNQYVLELLEQKDKFAGKYANSEVYNALANGQSVDTEANKEELATMLNDLILIRDHIAKDNSLKVLEDPYSKVISIIQNSNGMVDGRQASLQIREINRIFDEWEASSANQNKFAQNIKEQQAELRENIRVFVESSIDPKYKDEATNRIKEIISLERKEAPREKIDYLVDEFYQFVIEKHITKNPTVLLQETVKCLQKGNKESQEYSVLKTYLLAALKVAQQTKIQYKLVQNQHEGIGSKTKDLLPMFKVTMSDGSSRPMESKEGMVYLIEQLRNQGDNNVTLNLFLEQSGLTENAVNALIDNFDLEQSKKLVDENATLVVNSLQEIMYLGEILNDYFNKSNINYKSFDDACNQINKYVKRKTRHISSSPMVTNFIKYMEQVQIKDGSVPLNTQMFKEVLASATNSALDFLSENINYKIEFLESIPALMNERLELLYAIKVSETSEAHSRRENFAVEFAKNDEYMNNIIAQVYALINSSQEKMNAIESGE